MFQQRKDTIIDNLEHNKNDLSPIGAPDTPILHLLNLINSHHDYVTLSSCSGRLSIFQCKADGTKGGKWIVCQHVPFDNFGNELDELYNKLIDVCTQYTNSNDVYGDVQYKFEPLILHVACSTLDAAQLLLNISLQSGMRNSGIVVTNQRYTVQIRCTLKIEQIIIDSTGTLYVDKPYLLFMMKQVNQKFILNQQKIDTLYNTISVQLFNKQLSFPSIGHSNEHKELVSNKGTDKQSVNNGDVIDLATLDTKSVPVICCTATVAPHVQKSCKQHNFNDITRKINRIPVSALSDTQLAVSNNWLALPMTSIAVQQLDKTNVLQLLELHSIVSDHDIIFTYVSADIVPHKHMKSMDRTPIVTNKPAILQHTIEQFITKHKLSSTLSQSLQQHKLKWEQLGDCALLPNTLFNTPEWSNTLTQLTNQQSSELYQSVARVLNVNRIAIQHRIIDRDIARHSQVVMLFGDNSVVRHKENGVIYNFDICNAMFSSGNSTEKLRQIQLCSNNNSDEIIVDLYAGIGYFTLPILKYATNVKHLYACEINDVSVQYLQQNMIDNHIDSTRYTIYAGDNRCNQQLELNVYNTADRILLGLLPTSNDGWPIALRCIKPTGGYLHIHANVVINLKHQYINDMMQQLYDMLHTLPDLHHDKRTLQIQVQHIETVKTYAPRVVHIVIDVQLGHNIVDDKSVPKSIHTQTSNHAISSSPLTRYSNPTSDQFWNHIFLQSKPCILSDIDIGSCTTQWSVDNLLSLHSEQIVSVHICPEQYMRFRPKNYTYKTMTLHDMLLRMVHDKSMCDKYYITSGERYYMRSIGDNPRKEVADIYQSFPELAKYITIPHILNNTNQFSTVLRISSPFTTLWIHYDICDNILIQISGSKLITLFPPSQVNNLYIDTAAHSSTSPISDIHNYDKLQYPLFQHALHNSITIQLSPGECLFIPSLWSHSVTSTDNISVAVNIFWKQLDLTMYESKDLYGNKDLLYGSQIINSMHKINELLQQLPVQGDYREFYRLRALNILNNTT